MLHLIKDYYQNPDEKNINFAIMNREYEKDLYLYVVDCFKSISSVLTEITLDSWDFIIEEDKVDQSNYERTRSNKRKDQEQKYTFINESRVGELRLHFTVDLGNGNTLSYHRNILIPLADENGYFLIKGKKYISQYQLCETSTYVTSSDVILKSLMPIKVRKVQFEKDDMNKNTYTMTCFEVFMFYTYVNIMYFYLATMGWYDTLEYFSVGEYISVVDNFDKSDTEHTYFKNSNSVFIKVNTRALMSSSYIQSMTGTIIDILTNRMTIDDIMDKDYWTERIGLLKRTQSDKKNTSVELGSRYIILFNRMLDETTKSVLRLTDRNKRDVYAIIRWMIQHYDTLKKKDNLDVMNKRLRCNEYIASLLNGIISDKIKNFVNASANTDEKVKAKYDKFFAFRGTEILSKLHSSGLMKYDDIVNDMDFFERFKTTMKGPNSLGNKSSRNVSSKYRGLDTSYIGHFDLNFCSASDPGLTKYITPLCETDGMYFKGAPPEPEEFAVEFAKEMGEIDDSNDFVIIDPAKFNNVLDFICRITPKEGGE